MSKKDITIALLLNVLWGTSFTFAGYALLFYAPVFLYALRFFSTGIFTIPFNKFPTKYAWHILILSLLQAFTFYGIALGIKNIDSSTTAILTRLDIAFTIIFGAIFFKEKLTLQVILGVIICFVAIYIISGNIELSHLKFVILMIFSAMTAGLGNIVAKTIKNTDNKQIVAWSSLFMGIELFIVSFLFEKSFIIQKLNLNSILVIIYLGIVSSYFTYIILYYLLRKYTTSQIMPYNFLRPIVSVIFGFLLLGEEITHQKVAGIILILLGVYISQFSLEKGLFVVNLYKKNKEKIKQKLHFTIEH